MRTIIFALAITLSMTDTAWSAEAVQGLFGALPDGSPIYAVTLTNTHGMSARIITYGATLQSLIVPDKDGQGSDVILGYPDLTGYVTERATYGLFTEIEKEENAIRSNPAKRTSEILKKVFNYADTQI